MNDKNDSLIEIAASIMRRKKKPQSLDFLLDEVFEKKGITKDDEMVVAQFEVDFMLSGLFIYCGEDKHGNQLWDLKERQSSTLLDKDAGYLEDIYADDEDVIKNELKEDDIYSDKVVETIVNDDDIEEKDDEDDIEEELGLVHDDVESEEVDNHHIDDDEDEEEKEDDEDDIEEELNKRK